MRLTKIYTKTGDKGQTGLVGGTKVPKDSVRIEAYGTVDELNACLGLWRDHLGLTQADFGELVVQVATIQNEMHDLGAELATPLDLLDLSRQQVVTKESIERLEREIDAYNSSLPPLRNFVLPGGHVVNSMAHLCRTVCRRAERRVVTLAAAEPLRDEPRIYLNRLSDWLFVAGRHASAVLGVPEVLWRQAGKTP